MRDFLQNCCRKRIFFRYLQSERRQEVFPGRNSSAVEHFTRNEGVPSSNLGFGSKSGGCIAGCDLFFVCSRRRGRDAPHLPPAERRLRDTDAPHTVRAGRPYKRRRAAAGHGKSPQREAGGICCMADNKPTNLQKSGPGLRGFRRCRERACPTGVRAAPPESRRLPRRQTAVGRMCRGIRCAEVQNGCAPCPSYDLPQAEDLTGRRKEKISPF